MTRDYTQENLLRVAARESSRAHRTRNSHHATRAQAALDVVVWKGIEAKLRLGRRRDLTREEWQRIEDALEAED